MRGTVPELHTPHPMGAMLPSILQEDVLAMQFVAALDELLAPVIATLDSLDAYVDPRLAPTDFLEWLATWWVGADVDENWPIDRQRTIVGSAIELYRMRGTIGGLRTHLELATGGHVEIADNGGASWSTTPNAELPGEDVPRLAVAVHVPDPDAVDTNALDAIVTTSKPAHVAHRVEVLPE